jgi:hypothetical protein
MAKWEEKCASNYKKIFQLPRWTNITEWVDFKRKSVSCSSLTAERVVKYYSSIAHGITIILEKCKKCNILAKYDNGYNKNCWKLWCLSIIQSEVIKGN